MNLQNNIKIIVVEDEPIVAADIRARLISLGYDVPFTTASAEDVIKNIDDIMPDLLLIDIRLRGKIDGVDLAHMLKEKHDTPVIYITAYADEHTLQRAMATGAFGYIIKPFSTKELHSIIEISLYKYHIEQQLKDSEERYRLLAENATDMISRLSFRGTILYVSPSCYDLLGYEAHELIGQDAYTIIHPDDIDIVRAHYRAIIKEKAPDRIESRLLKKDGIYIWVETTSKIITGLKGEIKEFVAVTRDISERKITENEIIMQREELRALAMRLAEAEEIERQRISRELHDQVGQNLTALSINLNIIETYTKEMLSDTVLRRLKDSMSLVEQTAETIRNVMAELRPPVLDDYGLVAALRWYASQFSTRTGILINIESESTIPRLPINTENSLYRIVLESFTNIAKHSSATQITLTIRIADNTLLISIHDNGCGFDTTQSSVLSKKPKWGLLTMKERAFAIGGSFQLQSQPGKGTQITVEVAL